MKKLALTLAVAAMAGTACTAMAAQGDYVVVLNEAAAVTNENVTRLSDRVYLAPTYEDAVSIAPEENISSIFMDEALTIPETEFETEVTEPASLSEVSEYPFGANDTYYERQWYLTPVRAQSAWAEGLTGEGIKVAVIDTGINPVHVDLANKIADTFNTVTSTDSSNANDTYGHGTMVAGIISATTNNNTCVAGITDDAEISVIKIIENNKSEPSLSNLLVGITKAIDYDCDVVNISLGWTTENTSSPSFTAIAQEITRGVEKGMIFVASAGNVEEGTTKSVTYYPASFNNVISVGSLGRYKTDADEGKEYATAEYLGNTILADEPSTFTAHNPHVTCAAPGFRIAGTFISAKKADGTYTDPLVSMATSDGTSFASPIVASAAVIAKQLDPTINHARFEEYLKKSVRDVYTEGYDEYTGYGALDIEALIKVIKEDIFTATPSPMPVTGFDATVTRNESSYTVMTMFDEAREDFEIITAAYKNGRLVSVKTQSVNVGAMGINFRMNTDEEIDMISIMVWTPDGIYPLNACVKQSFYTPTDEPEDTAAPTDEPESTTVPTDEPEDTAAPTDEPESTTAPTDEPEDTAAPTDEPEDTAAPTDEPGTTPDPTEAE